MSALFTPHATRVARIAILAVPALALGVPAAAIGWVRTPWARGEHRRLAQPVGFDHRVHVTGLRVDCLYCHAGADRGRWAGLPATQTCVSCHSSLWMRSAPMAAVRYSVTSGRPISWRRVTQLPDYVYFDHSMHVTKGVGCEDCHGRVDRMAQVEQVAPLTMTWCVDCHRSPWSHLRPADAVTVMGWRPTTGSAPATAVVRRRVRPLTDCTTCHR